MLLMGDEVRRTQSGNNNAYCHDDPTNWFDWALVEKNAALLRFVTLLNERRVARSADAEHRRLTLDELLRQGERTWHGVRLGQPDWGHDSHTVAFSEVLREEGQVLHAIFNAYWEPLEFELPPVSGAAADPWRRWIRSKSTRLNSSHIQKSRMPSSA